MTILNANGTLGEKYVGKGTALAFKKLPYGNSELRVSEILISQWNGMRDSAQSMQTSERDVILLTNGVDRFSGHIQTHPQWEHFFPWLIP